MASIACLHGDKRFFFVHIQKTGGRSMAMALSAINPSNSAKTMHDTAHSLYQWFPREWDLYPSFAIVRNPFSRWVSIYHHYDWARQYPTFHDFIMHRKQWSKGWWPKDQWGMLCDRTQNIIVKHIGKFYQLQQSWDRFCDILGVPHTTLPYVGASPNRPTVADHYDEDTVRAVLEMSRRDFELFDYPEEPI